MGKEKVNAHALPIVVFIPNVMKSIELFAGIGGLALGISRAGFSHPLMLEFNEKACQTLQNNQEHFGFDRLNHSVILCQDVSQFNFSDLEYTVDLLAGGPPCQPFSIGGKHQGYSDTRDMMPQFVRAVREIKPRSILIENVKGLLRPSFSEYFQYIILQLTYPELVQKFHETWFDHLDRLEQYHTQGNHEGLAYRIGFRILNAANYGVAQQRDRVFIVGFRSDLQTEWSFPQPTHSQETLLWEKWITGEYWHKYDIPTPEIPERLLPQIQRLESRLFPPQGRSWRTIRDTITTLPDPTVSEDKQITNHDFVPGAKVYPGHTGSPIDEPAKTLKAGVHGVPGGENMMIDLEGKVRYFTVREAARLQSFPDSYFWDCSWTESMRQLGNAAPVTLAEILAKQIHQNLMQNTDNYSNLNVRYI